MDGNVAIETRNLTKTFGELVAVKGINLKIKKGEIFGLLGPNGAGKTTTLHMLATILRPTGGTAIVNGYDVNKQPDKVRKSIGIVFQDPSVDDELTGRENLNLHTRLYSVPLKNRALRIKGALKLVELENRADDLVRTYSGGMRRRLELARGLLHYPEVLFLDEPTLGLDPQTRDHIWRYIQNLAKMQKMTIILTTHYMEEAELLCDRVAIIDHGKILALDTPANLKGVLAGDVVKLKLKGGAKDYMPRLKKMSFIRGIKEINGELILTVKEGGKNLPEILEHVHGVASVDIHGPTLNDVFLYYTGRQIRETEGPEDWSKYTRRFMRGRR